MRIAITGMGKMGRFLAEILKKHNLFLYDINPEKLKNINIENAVISNNLEEITEFNPHIVINAVNLKNTIPVFKELEEFISPKTIIGDIASVKGDIIDYYKSAKNPFFSIHPMFGPTFANLNKVKGECVVIMEESDHLAKEFFTELFEDLGLKIYHFSLEEHDRTMAYSLTLPFVATFIFAGCIDIKTVPGTTFKKHLEIANGLLSEDNFLLSEILFNKHSVKEINKVQSQLEYLKHIINQKDSETAFDYLDSLRKNIEV
ncbi:prephenate dehydrogenase [Thermotomaculum hydrothermale]|uniref:Prephenate dehydrogenase n=1 Tax=Thermotomaculum hydrothermale TaxID=981385 RepID=A0A7R6PNY2_9BACT|nr:prephenate dehydrogenase/arogenate dehydrogenase family protein [Thermotomaculum hydrothermale]BBB33143.1 prephenate dehydrogenase [Thermotomaculum hydrothermale]